MKINWQDFLGKLIALIVSELGPQVLSQSGTAAQPAAGTPPKRGRPAAQSAAQPAAQPAAASGEDEITLESLREKGTKLVGNQRGPEMKAALEKIGVASLTTADASKYAEIDAALDALLMM